MKKSLIIISSLLVSVNIFASSLKTLDETKKVCNSSATEFGKGNYKKSMDLLKPYWVLPSPEIDNVAYQAKSQIELIKTRVGNQIGSEYLSTKIVGKSLVRHLYLAKFEKHTLVYECVLYKAKDRWTVNRIFFSDKLEPLFYE